MSNKRVTEDELIEIAAKMAQELQEFVDDAEAAGCKNPLPGTQALIAEWEAIYQRTNFCWQTRVSNEKDRNTEAGILNNL